MNNNNSMSEHDLQKNIVELLRYCGYTVFCLDVMGGLKFLTHTDNKRYAFINHYKSMGYTIGQPDLVILLNGKVIFIEAKNKKGQQTIEQKEVQSIVQSLGHIYLVWNTLEDTQKWIQNQNH